MDIDNLLFHCEHPKLIKTKSGQTMAVSCGKCIPCLVDKCRSRASLIHAESDFHQYRVFVTLTYAPEHVPTMDYYYDDLHVAHFIDSENQETLGDLKISKRKLLSIQAKSSDNKLHYARFSDAQKFLKRLRKHLKKYYNETIRYYIVSEYGPQTFRPHYHAVIFFNSAHVYGDFGKILSKTWSLGHFDYSQSRGGASNYVASYINSYVDIPEVFKLRSTHPRQSHSQRFALPTFSSEFKKTYKHSPSSFARIIRHNIHGDISSVAPWRSFKNFLFPKCNRFNDKSIYERHVTYGILPRLFKHYRSTKINDIAMYIMEDYHLNLLPSFVAIAFFNPHPHNVCLYEPPTFEILLQRLYAASHYYYLMVEFDLTVNELCDNISKFYSSLDYQNLKEQYQIIENVSNTTDDDRDMFVSAYAYGVQLYDTINGRDFIEVNGNLLELSLIKQMYSRSRYIDIIKFTRLEQYNKSLKHKTLNDIYLFKN